MIEEEADPQDPALSGDLSVGFVGFCPVKRVDMAVGMLDRGYGIANTGWGASGWCRMMTRMIVLTFWIIVKVKIWHNVDGVLLYFLKKLNVHTSSVKLVVLKDNLVCVPEAISKELDTWIAIQKAIIKQTW